jgi:L-ascorbate metabolism protein UlaG (beta-lactamase superfamily)
MLQHEGIQITWLGHDGFKLKKGKVVYVDPFKLGAKPEPADLVFVTHEHFDHLSVDDLKKVVTPATTVVTIAACEAAVKPLKPKAVRLVAPGDRLTVDGVTVEVLPAYNVNKFRAPGTPFHPKADGKVGFILGIGSVRIYHAGDTDEIPEMAGAKGVDVALLPVSGTYVMTAEGLQRDSAQAGHPHALRGHRGVGGRRGGVPQGGEVPGGDPATGTVRPPAT